VGVGIVAIDQGAIEVQEHPARRRFRHLSLALLATLSNSSVRLPVESVLALTIGCNTHSKVSGLAQTDQIAPGSKCG